ncbi:MAG: ABC transporter permease subunit [Clostridiaceae bacterium]|nr:ABC transporter permease subunit [Clostridiaceae bacterium]
MKPQTIGVFQRYIKNYQLLLMLLPTIFCLLIFNYAPIYGLIIAFKDYSISKGILDSRWVGFENFRKLFITPSFSEVFRNTIWISFLRILFGFPAPILLALLLHEIKITGYKKAVQTISYMPYFLSWVVLGGLFMQVLSPSGGLVNQIIAFFGGTPIYFLADTTFFVPMLIVTGIWQSVGWGSIIYLAAITSINTELYEAAVVDGAGRFKQMLHITLPGILPVISVMFILQSGNLINAGFDQIFNLYNSSVYKVADILDTYVYRRGLIDMKYSFSAAVGLFKNIISFALVIVTNVIVKKMNSGENGIW